MGRDTDEIEREANEDSRQSARGMLPVHASVRILAALVEEVARAVTRLRREVRTKKEK